MRGLRIAFIVSVCCGSLYGQWEADKRSTVYPGDVDYGSYCNAWTIAVRDTMVHIVWEHAIADAKLYYVRSINSGSDFEPDTRLTARNSHVPSVAVCDSIVHVVWDDVRGGLSEIYYKRHECEPSGIDESNQQKAKPLEPRVVSLSELGGVRFSIYLPRSSLVELGVFHVSGRSVDEREFAFPEGKHEFNWHNSKSGLYFFRFKMDGAETLAEKAIVF